MFCSQFHTTSFLPSVFVPTQKRFWFSVILIFGCFAPNHLLLRKWRATSSVNSVAPCPPLRRARRSAFSFPRYRTKPLVVCVQVLHVVPGVVAFGVEYLDSPIFLLIEVVHCRRRLRTLTQKIQPSIGRLGMCPRQCRTRSLERILIFGNVWIIHDFPHHDALISSGPRSRGANRRHRKFVEFISVQAHRSLLAGRSPCRYLISNARHTSSSVVSNINGFLWQRNSHA